MLRPFTFNMIIGMLRLKSVVLVLFPICSLCFSFLHFFPNSLYVTWTFLEFHFDLSIVFLCLSLYIAFVVVVLGFTLYMHTLWQSAGVILPIWVQNRNPTSLYVFSLFLIYSICLKYLLFIYLEPYWAVLIFFLFYQQT